MILKSSRIKTLIKQNISSFSVLFKSGKFLLLNSIIEKLIYFVFFAILARITVPEFYGQIVTINAFSNILSAVFEFGLGFYIQRETAISQEKIKSLIAISIVIKIAGFLLFVPLVLLYFYNSTISLVVVLLLSLSSFLVSSFSIFAGSLFGLQKFNRVFSSLLKARLAFLLLVAISVIFSPDYTFIISALFLSTAIYGFYLIKECLYLISLNEIKKIRLPEVTIVIKRAAPFALGVIFVWIYDRVDVLLLEKFTGLKAVAEYSVAYSIYKLPQIFSGTLLMPWFSKISYEYSTTNKIKLTELFNIGFILVIIAILFVLSFVCFGQEIINLIYGSNYVTSGWILTLLSIALPGLFLNNLTGVTLNSTKREKFQVYGTLSGLIINIVIGIYSIYLFGIRGAILVTIITEYIVLFTHIFFLIGTAKT